MTSLPMVLSEMLKPCLVGIVLSAAVLAFPSAHAAPALSSAHDPLAFGASVTHLQPLPPAMGRHGMVATAQHLATDVGVRVMQEGGNAVDAAVAVAYALAVVYPAAGNLGGGGFMTLRMPNGESAFIDFREHAPLAATPTMYQDAQGNVIPRLSIKGWKAVAVPGTVAGMELIHARWGKLSREKVMAPAIALARDGFVVNEADVELLHTSTSAFAQDPYARKIFLHPDGTPFQAGERLVQTDLAHTLELIAANGARAFYDGPIARAVVAASRQGGGILQMADFAAYKTRQLKPLQCVYRGYLVETAPPPSGGGVALCEMLNILSGYDLEHLGLRSVAGAHDQIEAMRHAYSDRRGLGDPAFVHDPVELLVNPGYAAAIRAAIPADRAIPSDALVLDQAAPHYGDAQPSAGEPEKHETTQFSVMDGKGMAVSVTYTLNGWFGAGVMGGPTGFFLNDEMDDFSTKPGVPNMFGIVGSKANAVAPGKTPLSSMTPTILSRDGRTVMVIGSPGGSRIPTITLAVILGVVDGGMNIQQAIDLPRIHEQWKPAPVEAELGALDDTVTAGLQREGYQITLHKPWGSAEGIFAVRPDRRSSPSAPLTEVLYGGFDRRHGGGSARGF
ncbi:gamma-glutamyltransferase [Acidomonas methanolica]|nr:gamma-glutamyltransferase [Acidomonas methanolica]